MVFNLWSYFIIIVFILKDVFYYFTVYTLLGNSHYRNDIKKLAFIKHLPNYSEILCFLSHKIPTTIKLYLLHSFIKCQQMLIIIANINIFNLAFVQIFLIYYNKIIQKSDSIINVYYARVSLLLIVL